MWLLSFVLLLGCAPAADVNPRPEAARSAWGVVHTLAQAETSAAPALLPLHNADLPVLLVWSGADAAEVRHYAGAPDADAANPRILTLRAFFPYAQALFPAQRDLAHLLYIDQHTESNERRLLAATVNDNLVAELGPNPVSDEPARHYSALPAANPADPGALQVVWSADDPVTPTLYAQTLDGLGRIRFAQALDASGTHPTLLHGPDDALQHFWLFWIEQRRVWGAELRDNSLHERRLLTFDVRRDPGDLLLSLQAARDASHRYLFWQIRRADGVPQVWWSSSPLAADNWSQPAQFALTQPIMEQVNTGYAAPAASVMAAASGTRPVWWLSPARLNTAKRDVLPVAVNINTEIGVVFLRAGAVVGYQGVMPGTGRLLSAPTIATDADGHLHLAWSQPNAQGTSDLLYTSTRS